MSTKVIMPQMGESVLEGTITKWLKNVGDQVTRDEPLFEISTDKVDSEIASPADGVLTGILASAGQTVQVNTVVAIIEESPAVAAGPEPSGIAGDDIVPAEPSVQVVAEKAADAVPMGEPQDSSLPPGEAAPAMNAPLPEQVTPPESGIGNEPQALPEEKAAFVLDAAAESITIPESEAETGMTRERQLRVVRASPLVRRIARDHGVELSRIEGTGLSGKITREDILRYLASPAGRLESQPAAAEQQAAAPAGGQEDATLPRHTAPAPDTKQSGASAGSPPQDDAEAVTMTPMRKAIAEHMVLSRRTSAHVQTVFEVDMTSVVAVHERHKDEFERREGFKLTYTPFFVKALVDTVRDHPILNTSVSGDQIIYKKQINVGIAVALDSGLIVPVVKDAHLKSFTALAHAIRDVAERARAKKLTPADVQQGTITITNPGVLGALFGTPIINQPQVAILDVGTLEKRPIIINDAIAIRTMAYLVLSFDHRVVDGAVADRFMAALKSRLQSWIQWIE
jgi:pyruvate dehydrogenase E2 component (dihydrolipoamide acetyltransferase)